MSELVSVFSIIIIKRNFNNKKRIEIHTHTHPQANKHTSGVVRWRNGQVTQNGQLIFTEFQLMCFPIIVMGALEIANGFSNRRLDKRERY